MIPRARTPGGIPAPGSQRSPGRKPPARSQFVARISADKTCGASVGGRPRGLVKQSTTWGSPPPGGATSFVENAYGNHGVLAPVANRRTGGNEVDAWPSPSRAVAETLRTA